MVDGVFSVNGIHILPGTEHDVLVRRGEEIDYDAIEMARLETTRSLGKTLTVCTMQTLCSAYQYDDEISDFDSETGETGQMASVYSSDVRCPIVDCPRALANLVSQDITVKDITSE